MHIQQVIACPQTSRSCKLTVFMWEQSPFHCTEVQTTAKILLFDLLFLKILDLAPAVYIELYYCLNLAYQESRKEKKKKILYQLVKLPQIDQANKEEHDKMAS